MSLAKKREAVSTSDGFCADDFERQKLTQILKNRMVKHLLDVLASLNRLML